MTRGRKDGEEFLIVRNYLVNNSKWKRWNLFSAINRALRAVWGVEVVKAPLVARLRDLERSPASMDLEFLQAMDQFDTGLLLRYLPLSHAQLRQDLFVLAVLGFPKTGVFCRIWCSRWYPVLKHLSPRETVWLDRCACRARESLVSSSSHKPVMPH